MNSTTQQHSGLNGYATTRWVSVTPSEPCEICGHGDWCACASDGSATKCQRSGDGCDYEGQDRSGVPFFVFRHTDGATPQQYRQLPSKETAPEVQRADDATLHAAYTKVLDELNLSTAHCAALKAGGLDDGTIDRNRYCTLTEEDRVAMAAMLTAEYGTKAKHIPGWMPTRFGVAGMLIPCRDTSGRIIRLRVRRDDSTLGEGDAKYLWISSKKQGGAGSGAACHVSLFTAGCAATTRITEGELKSDIATALTGVRSVSAPGVTSWRTCLPAIKAIGAKHVLVAFDSDADRNIHVATALHDATKQLATEGYTVELETWNAADAKGIDDLLAGGMRPNVLRGADAISHVDAVLARAKAVEAEKAAARRAEPSNGSDMAVTTEEPADVLDDKGIEISQPEASDDGDNAKPPAGIKQSFPPDDNRPIITITTDEPIVIDRAIQALSDDDAVFKRGGLLVHAICDASGIASADPTMDTTRIRIMSAATIQERMAGAAKWIKLKETKGELKQLPAHPPWWAVAGVRDRGEYPGIRTLMGITREPVLRPDGSILDTPGYDEQTGLLYEPSMTFPPVPKNPTRTDAEKAVTTVLEAFCDFPFRQPAHKSVCLAGVLTLLGRFAVNGSAPVFAIESNTPGSGKGLCVDAITGIALGRPLSRMSMPEDDAEMKKTITALAIEGERAALFDNADGVVGGASFDAAATAKTWKCRILGKSESTPELPLTTTFFITANNPQYNGDTTRRTLIVRLESPLERPEERDDFRHPSLIEWVRENRGSLVTASLTILRAYCVAGRPDMNLPAWGSYEAWSAPCARRSCGQACPTLR